MQQQSATQSADIVAENIGGIEETNVTFEPGVTVLAGRNATNRTSLLQAIMAGLGSNDVSLKADADEGHVELTIGGDTYTRTLRRQNGTISFSGDPYLDDSTLADLFAFLLESNEARRAVTTDADFREIIMRPVDTDEIQSEIDDLVSQRRDIESELDELDSLKNQLPDLEQKRTRLESEIEETQAELEAAEEQLESSDLNVEQTKEEQAELEEKLDTLREKRSKLEDTRYELETEKDSLESLKTEKTGLESEYAELPEAPAGEIDEIETQLSQLRSQKQRLETEMNEVQSVTRFNEEMLEDSSGDVLTAVDDSGQSDNGDLTEQLLEGEMVTCWTCGSDVDVADIESTVEQLQELSKQKLSQINDIDDEISSLTTQKRELEKQQRNRTRIERRLSEIETDIEDAETRIDDLKTKRDTLREEISTVETDVEEMENDAYEDILDLHKEANQLEYDLGKLESDLERVEENIETIESRLGEEETLKERREELNDEIEELRTRIERIEQQAIEEFNDHMDTVLELLEYENLARIWLERTQREVREGRRKVTKSAFELHIIRKTDSGTTFEDTVDNLSESEREVTGLIFALAGYLAHDLYETVPFMLLDSLEAIDADRIATLVEYLQEYNEYLVVALLPEDAAALSDTSQQISDI